MEKKIFTDKQQLATGFACSSRTVSPDEHCYRLICASWTQFHVPLGTQAFQLPQAASKQRSVPWCCRCGMFDFKTKLNGTILNGTMIPVVFFVHCSCISMKTSHIFFCGIHHIDPLHRKQTLTLSQCNSRDLTDSPYRKLEKCKKCYRYPFANRHLFHEHTAYI